MRPGPVNAARKIPSPTEQHIANTRYPGDLKLNTLFEHPDVAGVNPHRFTLTKVVDHDFAIQFDSDLAFTGQPPLGITSPIAQIAALPRRADSSTTSPGSAPCKLSTSHCTG
jgi:hypothetical protein